MKHRPTTESWLQDLQAAVTEERNTPIATEEGSTPFSTTLPAPLVAEVRALAYRESLNQGVRVTVAGIVATALREYLARHKG